MKNLKIIYTLLANSFLFLNAQVGINTDVPKATLDIAASPTGSILDGVIAPRVTGDVLATKTYGTDQNGAVVYVTIPASAANLVGQTIDVNLRGYYYYDSSAGVNKWVRLASGSGTGDTTQDVWKDVSADAGIISGPQSGGGPARSETATATTGANQTNYNKAVYTDVGNFGIGTTNPTGILHTYSPKSVYFDKIGNGGILYLRKSSIGSTASSPNAVAANVGVGQFVLTGYTGETNTSTGVGGWNENAGFSIQAYSTESWGPSNAGTGARFSVTPNGAGGNSSPTAGNGGRLAAMYITNQGKLISTGTPITGTADPLNATGRFSIQETTSDAFYINSPMADMSSLATGGILIWDTAGSVVTVDAAGNSVNTLNKGKVGYMPKTGLVKVSPSASPPSAGSIETTALSGSYYFQNSNTGIILTSPSGNKFKITVNDDGSLNSNQVVVP